MKINLKYELKKILAFCLIACILLGANTAVNATESAVNEQIEGSSGRTEETNKREELIKLIKEIDKLEEAEYTQESWKALKEIREQIADVEAIPTEYIQGTIERLTNVKNSLIKKDTSSSENDLNLDDGYYLLPMSSWQIDMINDESTLCSPRNSIKKQALLKVDEGQYEVTLGIRESDKVNGFAILKDKYFTESTPWGQKLGTLNWREGFNIKESQIHEDIKKGAIEENNKYWYTYTTENSENNIRYISFSPDNMTTDFRVHMIDKTVCGILDFNEAVAKKIDIEQIKKMNNIKYSLYYSKVYLEEIDNYFIKEAEWTVSDNIGVAKIVLDSSINNKFTDIKVGVNNDNLYSVIDNNFQVEFDLNNYRDVALGKTIYIEVNKDGYICSDNITIYPDITDKQTIEIEEAATGNKISTNTNIILSEAKLVSTNIVDTPSPFDAYTLITSKVKNKKRVMFNLHINQQNKKEIRFSEKVEVKFKIPDDWEKHKVKLFSYCENKGFEPDVKGRLEDIGDNSYFVIETKTIGSYALYQTENYTVTGENLEDGTYVIPVSVFKMTQEDEISMADACLVENATLMVRNKVKTLYLDFKSVEQIQLESYMSKMNLYDEDVVIQEGNPKGTLKPIVATSFYRNKDGSFLTDQYNENTINYYPKTGYIQLVSDEHRWPVRFSVPIMDAISGGDNDQDAWLALYWGEAKKISNETQDNPIKDALKQLIDIGDVIPSDRLTNVTKDIFSKNHKNAKTAYDNNDATLEELNKAYSDLKISIDDIKGYKIMFNSGINGNIVAHVDGQSINKGQLVPKGKTVVFTVTPNEGYTIKSWSGVNGESSSKVVNKEVDDKINVYVDFKKTDSGEEDPQQGENSLEKGNYYFVGVWLWHGSNNQASMGDAAFSNNRKALVYVNDDGSYSIQVCTNPVKIDDITAGLGSVFSSSVNNLTIISTASLTNGEDYISKFTFDTNSKREYYPITVTVPGSPMVGNFDARLRIDWNSFTKTSTTNLTSYSGITKGEKPSEEPESEKEKIETKTNKKIKANDLKNLIKQGKELIVEDSGGVKVKFDIKSIKAIIKKVGANKVKVEITKAKSSQLNNKQKSVVGDRPAYRFIVEANNKKIIDFGEGEVEITLPYTLEKDEKADELVVWYVDDKGKIEEIDCTYNKKTKTVIFKTKHFSVYTIAHKEIKVWQNPFTDIKESDIYYDDISQTVEKGLFNGISKSKFSPQENMSRAMLVTVLWRMEGSPNISLTDARLTDVVKGSYYEKAVAWAIKNEIVCGYEDNVFRPDEDLTMEQLIVIINRYAKYKHSYAKKAVNLKEYKDYTEISTYAKEAVEWAFSMDLVKATESNTISPKRTIIRAEAAQILRRFYLKIVS